MGKSDTQRLNTNIMIKKIESAGDLKYVVDFLQQLRIDVPWLIKIVRFRHRRTLSQNSMYHLWKAVIADEYGYTPAEMHDVLRGLYLPVREVEVQGTTHRLLTSTTALDTKQFTTFLDTIYRDFSAEGIILPMPGDRGLEELYEKYKDTF